MDILIIIAILVGFSIILGLGIRIVNPRQRGLIERLGKYHRFAMPGFHWIIPVVDRMIKVNITEMMVDAQQQTIITQDNLNAKVDAQVYFKVMAEEKHVMASQYNVFNYNRQIVQLARTTLRNIIGTMTLVEANSDRNRINGDLMKTLKEETGAWGIEVVRTELKEIDPPDDVQDTMNKIVKAENERRAAVDYATARETEADGIRRAEIKTAQGRKRAAILEAEGVKEAKVLRAQGEEKAIKLVHTAAQKYFKGNAQKLKGYETVQVSLKDNTKIIVPTDADLVNVVDGMGGIIPIKKK